jgi:single-strand DNA-binding protein
MGSVNKVILVGNLGRDAELKFTPGGFPISSFSLATTDRRKDKDNNWQEKTEWHRIKLLGKQAESLQDYLKKGKQIYVEGRLETRSWDDKEGQKRYMTEILADRIQLLGSGGGGGRGGSSTSRSEDGGGGDPFDDHGAAAPGDVADDDIPF